PGLCRPQRRRPRRYRRRRPADAQHSDLLERGRSEVKWVPCPRLCVGTRWIPCPRQPVSMAPSRTFAKFFPRTDHSKMKQRLLAPGPTPVPEETLLELAKPVVYHRTPESRQV